MLPLMLPAGLPDVEGVHRASPLHASGPHAPCFGANFTYQPSSFEREWTTGPPKQGRICELAKSPRQREGAEQWIRYSSRSEGVVRPPTSAESEVLSWLHCADGRREPIEPLTGTARHPRFPIECDEARPHHPFLFNTEYLVLKNACDGGASNHRHGRNILFDLGCSDYLPDRTKPSGWFSSIPHFLERYARNCLPFDRVYGWESGQLGHNFTRFAPAPSPAVYWSRVPASVKAILSIFNEPVMRTTGPSMRESDFNVLDVLRHAAKPDDFVVLKVDFDSDLESDLVSAIANSRHLSSLVDEILFEYHFRTTPNFGWRTEKVRATVDDALRLMSMLRAAGVRSHFWI